MSSLPPPPPLQRGKNKVNEIDDDDDNNALLSILSTEPRLHIDPRSYLEVYDMHHRYAKNLRSYYSFFDQIMFHGSSTVDGDGGGRGGGEDDNIATRSLSKSEDTKLEANDEAETIARRSPLSLIHPSSCSSSSSSSVSVAVDVLRENSYAAYPVIKKSPSNTQLFSTGNNDGRSRSTSVSSNSNSNSNKCSNSSSCGGGSNSGNDDVNEGGSCKISDESNFNDAVDHNIDEVIPPELIPKFRQFFDWLDGPTKPDVTGVSRQELDEQVVEYIDDPEKRLPYLVHFMNSLLYLEVANASSSGGGGNDAVKNLRLVNTGKDGYIYVMRDLKIYLGPKITKTSPRFHHSSFFGGRDVDSSGFLVVEQGVLKAIIPHSGHYRPKQDFHMLYLLALLKSKQLSLETIELDTQRINKLPRGVDAENKKTKKIETLHMEPASIVYDQLKHKFTFFRQRITVDLFKFIVKDKTENSDKYSYDEDYFNEIENDLESISPRSECLLLFTKGKVGQIKRDSSTDALLDVLQTSPVNK